MKSGKNKNTVILIISAVLILIAVIIAVTATISSKNKSKDKETTTNPVENVSVDLGSIADMNNKTDNTNTNTNTNTNANPNTTANKNSYVFEPGKYKVATKDDPLGLRLEPNTASDRIIYVPKGHEVEVLAVWEDWGYVVYEKTGGWLSMNYLELVSGSSSSSNATTEKTAEQ